MTISNELRNAVQNTALCDTAKASYFFNRLFAGIPLRGSRTTQEPKVMARIPEAEIARLKEGLPVQRLVEASGVELKKGGNRRVGGALGSGLASCPQGAGRRGHLLLFANGLTRRGDRDDCKAAQWQEVALVAGAVGIDLACDGRPAGKGQPPAARSATAV